MSQSEAYTARTVNEGTVTIAREYPASLKHVSNGETVLRWNLRATGAAFVSLVCVVPTSTSAATNPPVSVTVAVAGEQRVGVRKQGKLVLAFSSDGFEGECHVGRKSSSRLVTFDYRRSGSGEVVSFRMRMRHVRGKWIPRRTVTGEPMSPTRTRNADLKQLDRCLRWMRPTNPQLGVMEPLAG